MPPLMDGRRRRRRENATRTRPILLDPLRFAFDSKIEFRFFLFLSPFFLSPFLPPRTSLLYSEKRAAFVRTRRHTFRVATKRETLDSLALLPIEAE